MEHNISLLVGLFVFLVTPFLLVCVWQPKQASGSLWKAYPLCLVVCGIAFAAGFLLASVVDAIFYTLAHAFQLDLETSAMAAKVAINLMVVLPASLAGLCVVRKIMR